MFWYCHYALYFCVYFTPSLYGLCVFLSAKRHKYISKTHYYMFLSGDKRSDGVYMHDDWLFFSTCFLFFLLHIHSWMKIIITWPMWLLSTMMMISCGFINASLLIISRMIISILLLAANGHSTAFLALIWTRYFTKLMYYLQCRIGGTKRFALCGRNPGLHAPRAIAEEINDFWMKPHGLCSNSR